MKAYTSSDYNKILEESTLKIEELEKEINFVNNKIEERLKIIDVQNRYNAYLFEKIKDSEKDRSFLAVDSDVGDFKNTGITVHPEIIGHQNNVFNLSISKSNNYHFRQDVQCTTFVNEVKNITNILKHDSIMDKEITYLESPEDEITLTISKTNGYGYFNASSIEFDNLLKDSVDIKRIIFYRGKNEVHREEAFFNIGKSLHPLKERVSFDKVEIVFSLKYKLNEKYIFSMKHIYFYDSLYNDKSYVLVESKFDKNIDYIEPRVRIRDHKNEYDATVDKYGIRFYTSKDMAREIIPRQRISDNYKKVFIKIPLINENRVMSVKSIRPYIKYR